MSLNNVRSSTHKFSPHDCQSIIWRRTTTTDRLKTIKIIFTWDLYLNTSNKILKLSCMCSCGSQTRSLVWFFLFQIWCILSNSLKYYLQYGNKFSYVLYLWNKKVHIHDIAMKYFWTGDTHTQEKFHKPLHTFLMGN